MQEYEFSRSLGDAVKVARGMMNISQNEVASKIDVDPRTILNIENYHSNPKMKSLYPLIRLLKIDPQAIFYPETKQRSDKAHQLQLLLADCTEQEAALLIPICQSVLQAVRSKNADTLE